MRLAELGELMELGEVVSFGSDCALVFLLPHALVPSKERTTQALEILRTERGYRDGTRGSSQRRINPRVGREQSCRDALR